MLLFALASTLAACADSKAPKTADSNTIPTKYKDEVIETLKELFVKTDTVSVTGAFITDPTLRPVDNEQHYTICVRYMAHSTVPGVTGNAERIGYFYNGHLNQLVEADGGQCRGAPYKPFPELDRVCIGTGCK